MRKTLAIFLILSFFSFFKPVYSQENNKFGIHITHSEDLLRAKELVNSQGGDWGYITVVIQDNDLDYKKWQNFFDLCRENHLIPLIRIATHLEGEIWKKPTEETLKGFVDFLDSLNWPVKNRYIIVFNEPNHNKEWEGKANPKEYAQILDKAIIVFKDKNPDFFLLNAGFDQAAPDSQDTIDEVKFLKEMNFEIPGIFEKLDGWASHSYPNHGFVGKPWDRGRATVKGYDWELFLLKNLGIKKDFSVFITETGWPHQINSKLKIRNLKFYNPEVSAEYIKYAYKDVWLPDGRVVAVTPFILNYSFPPFENFSWIDEDGNPYLQFEEIKNLPKKRGTPYQEEKYEIVDFSYPSFLPTNFVFFGKITLKNNGQSIWGERPFRIKSQASYLKLSDLNLPEGILIKPGGKWTFKYTLETPSNPGEFEFSWNGLPKNKITILEIPKLTEKKTSFLNSLLKNILNFCYN